MPDMINFSPFPNFRYYSSDKDGRNFGVVIIKATYQVAPSGRLLIAEEQAPMVFDDECHGEVNSSSLWHPSDLVPHKPRTDIIVNAIARSPNCTPQKSWLCGIQIENPNREVLVSKALTVTGPRWWVPQWRRMLSDDEKRDWKKYREEFAGWELSDPEPILELPVHYEYAYGGLLQQGFDESHEPIIDDRHDNPIGRGWIDREWTDHTMAQPAPQIELYGAPITDPYQAYKPQSLGPIPCAWEPRLPLAGTYDQQWLDQGWPKWPKDYQFAYHNSAHPDLICPHYVAGNERIGLLGMLSDWSQTWIELPGDKINIEFIRPDGSGDVREPVLDTIFIDAAAPRLRDTFIYLTWRIIFEPDLYQTAIINHTQNHKPADVIRKELRAKREARSRS